MSTSPVPIRARRSRWSSSPRRSPGPFDLGNVVVRVPLFLDPETAQIHPDERRSPTSSAAPSSTSARSSSTSTARTSPSTGPTAAKARPRGDRRRRGGPDQPGRLRGLPGLRPVPGERLQASSSSGRKLNAAAVRQDPARQAPETARGAEGARQRRQHPQASVALPHALFLDQASLATVCTRVQFAAEDCPKRSIYGKARAFTPAARQTARRPGLPALLEQHAARHGRPPQGPGRHRPGRADRQLQRRHPHHLRPRPRRAGEQSS